MPTGKILKFGGLSVHYQVLMPSGPVYSRVLLIPSPGQSTFNWRYVVPELLSGGAMCVLCDLPGFGLSSCGPNVSHRQDYRARVMWGVLDEVDMQYGGSYKCWNLIAHGSAAGTIAVMAMMSPDSIASLIMINPMLYRLIPRGVNKIIRGKRVGGALKRWYRGNIHKRRKYNRLISKLYGMKLPVSTVEKMRTPLIRPGCDMMLPRLLTEGFSIPDKELGQLFMPIMVLWGGRDWLLGDKIPKKIKKDLKSAEFHIIRSAGHCAHETNSGAVCDFLRGWLREMG